MMRCAWLLLAMGMTAQAAQISVEPGAAADLDCPVTAVRSARRTGQTHERAPSAARKAGHAAFRMAIWGDSHTAGAAFTEGMLSGMGLVAEDVMPTFMPPTWLLSGVAHPLRASCASSSWRTELAYQGARAVGAALAALTSDRHDSMLAFDFRWPHADMRLVGARLHVSKQRPDRPLVLGMSADGGPETMVVLNGAVTAPVTVLLQRPAASLKLRLVAGEATVHGLSPSYADRARTYLDVFSIPGATVNGWRHADVRDPVFASSKPVLDLALIQYGTNDALQARQRLDDYETNLRESLRHFRLAYPGVRCVLIGPPDRGWPGARRNAALAHAQVGDVQQHLAREFACSFWDWQQAMGGPGSAAAGKSRLPATVQPDLIHLTARGYRESGQAFGEWLTRPGR